jgi:hypothetical protein
MELYLRIKYLHYLHHLHTCNGCMQVGKAARVALTKIVKEASAPKGQRPRALSFAEQRMDGKRPCVKSESVEGEAERPNGVLQNQSLDAVKETVPPVEDTEFDERDARNHKASKADDAKVERVEKIRT